MTEARLRGITGRPGRAAAEDRFVAGPALPPGQPGQPAGLARALDALAEAIAAATALGLATDAAASVHQEAASRLRLPVDSYVLALVGGTGVGKSSLLNALAEATVSPAGVRRPTTAEPVAWLPEDEHDLEPVLDWLGVTETRRHRGLPAAAVLDLPDLDSVAPAHAARVDELLPRLDAVAWIVDPEKYADELLHATYLRRWAPRLARQLVVLNKADRLDPAERRGVLGDVRRLLAADGLELPVVATSAVGEPGAGELRDWISRGADAKAIVVARLAASIGAEARDLADRAGVGARPGAGTRADVEAAAFRPLLEPGERRRIDAGVTDALLAAIDLDGLRRQAVATTVAGALPRGGGPLGVAATLVSHLGDGGSRTPRRQLVTWRERGSAARAADVAARGLADVVAAAPPELRPGLASAVRPAVLQAELEALLDDLPGGVAGLDAIPSSRAWLGLGLLQAVAIGVLAAALGWLAVTVLAIVPGGVRLPGADGLGSPLLLLLLGAAAGYLLLLLLRLHARWLGRRWADGLSRGVRARLDGRVDSAVFGRLDTVDGHRRRLQIAAAAANPGTREVAQG